MTKPRWWRLVGIVIAIAFVPLCMYLHTSPCRNITKTGKIHKSQRSTTNKRERVCVRAPCLLASSSANWSKAKEEWVVNQQDNNTNNILVQPRVRTKTYLKWSCSTTKFHLLALVCFPSQNYEWATKCSYGHDKRKKENKQRERNMRQLVTTTRVTAHWQDRLGAIRLLPSPLSHSLFSFFSLSNVTLSPCFGQVWKK